MPLKADLTSYVSQLTSSRWERRASRTVPEPESIPLGNVGIELDATCLYADLADSTKLVNGYADWFTATVYKTFLYCATKLIQDQGGSITSFDGDRVMGVFLGDQQRSSAVRAAMKINWITSNVVSAVIKRAFNDLPATFGLSHTCGIDSSRLFAVRSGVRGSNDVVWVGRAANYAAKLATFRDPRFPTMITAAVIEGLPPDLRLSGGAPFWQVDSRTLPSAGVFNSSYWIEVQ